MARLSAKEYADKMIRRVGGALDDMKTGIEKVSVAPSKKAVEKKAKMKANLIASIDNGKWEKNLGAVTLDDWKGKMVNIGLARVQPGIEAARSKIEVFAEKFFPFQDQVLAKINAMPDATLEERIAKSAAYMRESAKFQFIR